MKSSFHLPKKSNLKVLACLFLFVSSSVFSKDKKWEQTLSGANVAVGHVITAVDADINSTDYFTAKSATYVSLKVDDFIGPFFWYKYDVKLKITPILNQGIHGTPYTVNLNIENMIIANDDYM